jgi:capsular polysaccharide biosynthesis protein
VITRLRLETTPKKLLAHFRAATGGSSAVLQASYDGKSPRGAEQVLGAFTAAFVDQLDQKLGFTAKDVTVFNPPHADDDAVSPKPVTTLAFAGMLGLALGLLIAVFVDKTRGGGRRKRAAVPDHAEPVLVGVPKSGAEEVDGTQARDAGAL